MAQIPVIQQPIWCASSPETDLDDWMKNLKNITIYGDQQSKYNLYRLGQLQEYNQVSVDLGNAARFIAYDQVTNTLKV